MLCELWGSDFRTHTTKKNGLNVKKKLEGIIKKYRISKSSSKNLYKKIKNIQLYKEISINENYIIFKNKNFLVSFNLKKGLAINNFIDKKVSKNSLLGTIIQGEI